MSARFLQITVLLLPTMITLSTAKAAGITASGYAFAPDTDEIAYQVEIDSKATVTGALVVVDVGDIAPPGYKVVETELNGKPGEVLTFTFSKPNNGWPAGRYKIIISDSNTPIHSTEFSVVP
jgi:hypothetical protein